MHPSPTVRPIRTVHINITFDESSGGNLEFKIHLVNVFRANGEKQLIVCASLKLKPWIFIMDATNEQVTETVSDISIINNNAN